MENRQIKRVPVVRGSNVVGIVSRANLLHALASVARETKSTERDDEAIRALLLAELAKESWAPVTCGNGPRSKRVGTRRTAARMPGPRRRCPGQNPPDGRADARPSAAV
jgi:hypothetical protein